MNGKAVRSWRRLRLRSRRRRAVPSAGRLGSSERLHQVQPRRRPGASEEETSIDVPAGHGRRSCYWARSGSISAAASWSASAAVFLPRNAASKASVRIGSIFAQAGVTGRGLAVLSCSMKGARYGDVRDGLGCGRALGDRNLADGGHVHLSLVAQHEPAECPGSFLVLRALEGDHVLATDDRDRAAGPGRHRRRNHVRTHRGADDREEPGTVGDHAVLRRLEAAPGVRACRRSPTDRAGRRS